METDSYVIGDEPMTAVSAAINRTSGVSETTALMNVAGEYARGGGSAAMIVMDATNMK